MRDRLINHLDLKRGMVEGHRDGFGFVIFDDKTENWFLSSRQMRNTLHRDEVLVRLKDDSWKGKTEASIVKALKPGIERVVDLRKLPLLTIDGSDARDFDDAVHCVKENNQWRLWVAIAEVSHYVQPESTLDQEAIKRGNSVYFPGHVVPMLPEILSNGLCSLNPDADRLCMVCEMTISEQGKLKGYKFYPAQMRSHGRLTNSKVNAVLQDETNIRKQMSPLVGHLEELYALYKALLKTRKKRGAIDFDTVETRIEFTHISRIMTIFPLFKK